MGSRLRKAYVAAKVNDDSEPTGEGRAIAKRRRLARLPAFRTQHDTLVTPDEQELIPTDPLVG